MTLTKLSLSNPVAVIVACILISIFGVISLTRLPIQMTPDISRPEITISTAWRASAPNEVESEIIELEPFEDPEDQLAFFETFAAEHGAGIAPSDLIKLIEESDSESPFDFNGWGES